jgi:polar amino acid transport system substrate-binding protein
LNGKPLELLMPIYKHSPYALVAINDKSIKTLKNLQNSNITIDQFALKNPSILAMLKSHGIDIEKLHTKQQNIYSDNELKRGVYVVYISNEIYDIKQKNIPYKVFNPHDYGIDYYGDILFSSQSTFKNNPEEARKIIKATKEGYKYAFSHIDETINVILDKYNTQHLSYQKLKYEATTLKTILSDSFVFNKYKIRNIENLFLILGMTQKHLCYSEFVYTPSILSKKEKIFLQSHLFRCAVTANWEPFGFVDSKGMVTGIGVDYWNLVKQELGINSEYIVVDNWNKVLSDIKNKKVDITPSTHKTPDKEKYAVFSKPYISSRVVIATLNNVGFISDISILKNKMIAVGKNYSAYFLLRQKYPKLKLLQVKNIDEALRMVSEGKVFAAADILPVIAYKINKYSYSNLKISGRTDAVFNVRFMVRKDYKELIPILNRAIDNIGDNEKNAIYRKYITVNYQNGYSKRYVMFVLGGMILLVVLFVVWLVVLKKEILKRKKLEAQLEKMAIKDRLTNIYNRYKLDIVTQRQIIIANRYKRPLSFIFFDIDYFKKINDTYGHQVGDDVLKELSSLVASNIRGSDIFGRWGGEEFLIICPETTFEEAYRLAEKLRVLIFKYKFSQLEKGKISCSFGVAMYKFGDTVKSTMLRLDRCLYLAKQNGRNRVEGKNQDVG